MTKTYRTKSRAIAAVKAAGLCGPDTSDYVTVSGKAGHYKPIVHTEHYADAEYISPTYGFQTAAP